MSENTPTSVLNESAAVSPSPSAEDFEKQQQIEEWRSELTKTEEEINTLRGVLHSKMKRAAELKKQLGIGPMQELKADLSSGLQSFKESSAYHKVSELGDKIENSDIFRKTKEGFNKAGEKTTSAFSTVGKKLANVRNSDTFKSFEDKLSSVKSRVTGSKSEQNFDEALREATEAVEAEKAAKSSDEAVTPASQ